MAWLAMWINAGLTCSSVLDNFQNWGQKKEGERNTALKKQHAANATTHFYSGSTVMSEMVTGKAATFKQDFEHLLQNSGNELWDATPLTSYSG